MEYETDYLKALSFAIKYFYSFRILKKGRLFDVIPFSANIKKGWKTIKVGGV